jgi:hypothetical protein
VAATAEATTLPGATCYHLRNATWSIAWTTSGGSNYLEAHGGEPGADRGHESRVAGTRPWRRGAPAAAAGAEAGALGGRRGARVRGVLLLQEGGGPLPAHRRGHPVRRRRSPLGSGSMRMRARIRVSWEGGAGAVAAQMRDVGWVWDGWRKQEGWRGD